MAEMNSVPGKQVKQTYNNDQSALNETDIENQDREFFDLDIMQRMEIKLYNRFQNTLLVFVLFHLMTYIPLEYSKVDLDDLKVTEQFILSMKIDGTESRSPHCQAMQVYVTPEELNQSLADKFLFL